MSLEHPPPPFNYNQPQIQYQRDYILQILHRGSMISGHWFTVSMYSALQWCHIRCIYRLKLCRQDMLELLRGTVSSRRSFIQQQHSFISTVGRSITFAYRIVASHESLMVSARRRQQKAYAVVT